MFQRRFVLTIAKPVAQVFTFTTDLTNLPQWAAGPTAAEQTSAGPVGVGTTYQITAKPPVGPPRQYPYRVTEYVANERFAGQGQFGPFPFRERYTFESTSEGTRLTQVIRMEPHGPWRVLEPLLMLLIPLLIRSDLNRLRKVMENRDWEPSTDPSG